MARNAEPQQTRSVERVTISIVSHGHGTYVSHLLDDLREAAARIDKVVVTRNIPQDDGLARLDLPFAVEFIDNPAPKGFGANHNAAFARCHSPWFLVLNPDLRMEGETIGKLLDQSTRASGVIAPRVVEPAKAAPEPRRKHLTPLEIMGRWIWSDYDAPRAEWVAGMFMLFRSAAFAGVRGFDEKFFMYVEDADICARLRLAGWDVTVDESERVLHHAQRASDRNWRALGWHWASLLRWWVSPPFWRLLAGFDRRSSTNASSVS
jgi:N-acetylglucosaminyl-diphospho-decaprenol L-rhamnosyltransferase